MTETMTDPTYPTYLMTFDGDGRQYRGTAVLSTAKFDDSWEDRGDADFDDDDAPVQLIVLPAGRPVYEIVITDPETGEELDRFSNTIEVDTFDSLDDEKKIDWVRGEMSEIIFHERTCWKCNREHRDGGGSGLKWGGYLPVEDWPAEVYA